MNTECVFCKIVKGEERAKVVYEDKLFIAFEDKKPLAPVHVLVVTKKHYPTLMDCDEPEILSGLLEVAKKVAEKKGVENGFKVLMNTGRKGGQTVFHLHLHVLSRMTIRHLVKAFLSLF